MDDKNKEIPSFIPLEKGIDIDAIERIVERHFNVYDYKFQEGIAAFYVSLIDKSLLEEKFDSLRKELQREKYIPFFREKGGENVVFVVSKPEMKTRPVWINIVLFIATVITTVLSGSILFLEKWNLSEIFVLKNLLYGFIFFSFPLLSILGIHELGHYFVSKRHGVATSLPFFIPIPPNPILPLGTMGAFISMREPIPNRKALLDIGAAGPICGFVIAIPVLIVGLAMSSLVSEIPSGALNLGEPLLLSFLTKLMIKIPEGYTLMLHPTAFAGWVGLLVTAINLLPAGQLDGGHIARAILGEKHKYASWGAIALMMGMGMVLYEGWLFMAILVLFLLGTRHPPPLNDAIPLDSKRKWIAFLALLIFVLSFAPIPISS